MKIIIHNPNNFLDEKCEKKTAENIYSWNLSYLKKDFNYSQTKC